MVRIWLYYRITAIDYFLADNVMVPNGSEHLFSEKPWRLKKIIVFVVTKQKQTMGDFNNLPALSNGFITFGTLTRTIRINDRVIKAWADILKKYQILNLIINSKNFQIFKTAGQISCLNLKNMEFLKID